MSPEEFEQKMKELFPTDKRGFPTYYEEEAHEQADELMGDILTHFGYGAGVEVFKNAAKWYA